MLTPRDVRLPHYRRITGLAADDGAAWQDVLSRARTVVQHHIADATRDNRAVLILHRREALHRHPHLVATLTAVGPLGDEDR